MRLKRVSVFMLAGVLGGAVILFFLGLLGMASPVLAAEQELEGTLNQASSAQPAAPEFSIVAVAVFTDPASVPISDLTGNIFTNGSHEGKLVCRDDKCSHKTMVHFALPVATAIQYKLKSGVAIDPENETVIVAGTGSIFKDQQKEAFTFTATFQNNEDGTVYARYDASRPDASLIIPKTAGTLLIFSRP